MSEMKIFSSKVAYIPDDYFLKNIKKNYAKKYIVKISLNVNMPYNYYAIL